MERVRSQHLEPDRRGAIEPEADDRPVAEAVAVRADGREQPVVARERTRAVRYAQVVEAGEPPASSARPSVRAVTSPTVRMGTPRRLATNGTLDP